MAAHLEDRAPTGALLAAFAPAAVGLTLFVAMTELRMTDEWAHGTLAAFAAAPSLLLLSAGLGSARRSAAPLAAVTIFLVAGLLLAAIAIVQVGELANPEFTSRGGTLTWMLLVFDALAILCASRGRCLACLLIAALASVGLLLEAVNWIFSTEDLDVFRALLALSFVVLFGAGLAVGGRTGVVLVGAAGVTLGASGVINGFSFFFSLFPASEGLGWGWELLTLLQSIAILAFACSWLEPGPAYLAVVGLTAFVTAAAGSDERTLAGWPVALAIATVIAALWGLRGTRLLD